jgi:hypothetical protein
MKNRNITALALLLGAVTLAIYMPVKTHDFLDYDDDFYVTKNFVVQHGLTFSGHLQLFMRPTGIRLPGFRIWLTVSFLVSMRVLII